MPMLENGNIVELIYGLMNPWLNNYSHASG